MVNDVEVYNNSIGLWAVSLNGDTVKTMNLKQGAERHGREVAKENSPSQLTVYNLKQGISYRQFYD